MGNVTGKEEGANGVDDGSVRSGLGDGEYRGRTSSVDSMGNTSPGSPGRSRSPLPFNPQIQEIEPADQDRWIQTDCRSRRVPLAPIQRVADPPIFINPWMNDSNGLMDLPPEKAIPILITWNCGGIDVTVEGSWDNWSSRKLHKSGKDHSLLLVLPCGIYHYRFIIDGEWKYIPNLPHVADEMGHHYNLLDVTDYVPENLDSVSEFELPRSPDSSYSRSYPADEDFAKEPPVVPQQLHLSILETEIDEEISPIPQHVVLDHLFMEKGWASQSLVALGQTHRYESKYVTVVLYKPLRRRK